VKLLQRLKIWRELKRLETRVRETPSPTTFVDLGQVYINLGLTDQTLRVSEEGLALFPNSQELRKLNKFAKRSLVRGQIKDLRNRLNKTPQPELYQELAGLYLELGDYGAVYGTCEESVRRFPDDAGSHLLMARARLANFYRDLNAREGLEAVHCLQTVVGLDPRNARAHKMLAELMYRVGAAGRAQPHLEILRQLAPGDLDVEVLYRHVQGRGATDDDDLDELFCGVEARRGLAHGPVTGDGSGEHEAPRERGVNTIRDALGQIAEIPGVSKAAYIRGSKALIKGEIRNGKDPFLRLVRVVSKASQRTCRRMDLGNFSKGVLDGDFGHVCICTFGEVVAAVLCRPGTAVDRILGDLQELVAKSLYLAETGAR
jgi:tetratricopeptide (TPR) repeat protein